MRRMLTPASTSALSSEQLMNEAPPTSAATEQAPDTREPGMSGCATNATDATSIPASVAA